MAGVMEATTFTIYTDGVPDDTAEAETKLTRVLLNPEACRDNWESLGEVKWELPGCPYKRGLLVLALMANPVLRDEAWNALGDDGGPVLTDKLKAWLVFNEPETAGAAADYVRQVVREVVAALYVEGDEEEVMP
jgi:hypothetical protein